ncbi:FAD/NAD(P)-binding domain-containing protein [Parathielavia appendiculata]|uniref:FAD/NAD(P)-binding domain-containing protein n=1 Tax=Parathielavia appendiculata TaxID=2587402 RepID=A0AAN6TRR0_9PEZI|nr:FAD/NAD(P)-binding domain-containing protein [Parathielavia appendiculata]
MEKTHVCVVGAGISGLRCADILLSHGFKVTIFEARDRIGGRGNWDTRPICECLGRPQPSGLELTTNEGSGPNWIHAYRDAEAPHPIHKLATETNTPLHHWNNKQLLFDPSGNKLPDDLTERLSTTLWEIIEQAFEFSKAAHDRDGGQEIPINDSLQDFIRRKAHEVISDENERELLVHMSEMFGAYVGEPVWKQSLRFAWMEECCGGEEMFVASNYSSILALAAKPALDGATIHLNTCVVGVSFHHAPSNSERQAVTVTTSYGQTLSFDEVVMTTPLGWLKRNHTAVFNPPLPPRLNDAIANISLSQLEKVFINFPAAFWKKHCTHTDQFPCYTNWLTPSYAPSTNPSKWPQEIWDLSSFAEPNNHPTILFYLYGDCARHVVDLIHGQAADVKHRLLDDFFRPYYSKLPGYDAVDPDCRPRAILATEWFKDELSGNASYCNFQVGVEAADQDVLALREGCVERRLWFCGEHAAPFEECGTVAGAYLSGESTGMRIVEFYKGRS